MYPTHVEFYGSVKLNIIQGKDECIMTEKHNISFER